MTGPARHLSLGLAVVLGVLVFAAAPASGHETEQPYLYVFVGEDSIDGRAELAIGDVAAVLGLDLSGDDAAIEDTLRGAADALRTYVDNHTSFGTEGESWVIDWGRIDLYRESSTLAFAVVQYRVDAVPPPTFTIRFDPFFDDVDGRDGLILLRGGLDDGVYDPDEESLFATNADQRDAVVGLEGQSGWGKFRSGVTLGIDHIETGPDHILFVLALLLPSVLVFRDGWQPVAGFGGSLWRVLKIATFFTIAHSITFTLAGMDWLPLPPAKLTETIIAASIGAAALHNLRPVVPNREWALAFAFGLFHGMGFASLVSGLEVSRTSQLISLLGRNVGIEIGQVVVILLLFPALYLLRRTPAYPPFLTVASIGLAIVAFGWMVERLAEVDLGTNGLVDRFASSPNGYVVAGIVTVVAGAIHMASRRQGTLTAVD